MFRKLLDLFAQLGPLNAVFWGINRFFMGFGGRSPIVRYYFVAQPVPEKPLLATRHGRSIEVRMLRSDDPALSHLLLTSDVLRFRFDQDAVCFGAFREGTIVGCLWLCLGGYHEDEVRCRYDLRPEGKAAWDFDVYVIPEARGGFAFMRLWDEANAYLRKLGVGWSLSRISAFNPGSLAVHGNLGACRIGSALFFRTGDLQLGFYSFKPYFNFTGSPDRIPRLVLVAPSSDQSG